MRPYYSYLCLGVLTCLIANQSSAQTASEEVCPRGAIGATVTEPKDLRSTNGVLRVELFYRRSVDANGLTRYCYIDKDRSESPTLRAKPGDRLVLTLRNDLPPADAGADHVMAGRSSSCAGGPMTSSTTNLHFHGLTIPPVCHQDDVLKTMIQPESPPFEYSFRIPADEPPGLYWYHPHVHGFNKVQVLGGASGALIVEGIEMVNSAVSGLPERVIIIRDQDLMNPNAAPVQTDSMPPPQVLRDAEGDILNTGTGTGKPAKDLSINFVPVPYPEYRPATISIRPEERELWRVLNASAITYLDLQVLFDDQPQAVGEVALDGVPVNENGNEKQQVVWKRHVLIPPAGREEFIVKGPKEGVRASLVTRTVDTGPAGENDPTRPLATIVASSEAPETGSRLPLSPPVLASQHSTPLKDITPVRERRLYFSEKPQDPKNPNSPTVFYLTVEGKIPTPFDPNAAEPDIVVRQGDVEDWIIENRSQELHDFHIHQLHFQLLEWNGVPVDEPYLRDTINVAYWDGHSRVYPTVKLRMDFRDPNIVGTFVYHCHLLEHEDGGMMGTIRVEPASGKLNAEKRVPESNFHRSHPSVTKN
ncbi:MAG TPA: multicopper oxidase domain-containing protein [Candidatus Aquilonibacter sp.]|nr:multicopper oxidase domain-containing protein [Candidatus Aquilonibacter sp.]